MQKKQGKQTVMFSNPVGIYSAASVVGPKEGEGPLGTVFDRVESDIMFGKESWEKAESEFARAAYETVIKKADAAGSIDYVIAGDLLNQSTGSVFGLRDTNVPYLGIFGACSAMGEGMNLGGMLIDGGFADKVCCVATSHFCSAEKQFRYPLEFGAQRPPTSSWTVTGAAAVVLDGSAVNGPKIAGCTTGKMVDMGSTDANNMGAAMAGAAADTICAHFEDLGRQPEYYDIIATGDLGYIGSELLSELVKRRGYNIADRHEDCGIKIFDKEKQDTHAGGSGCACSGVVFASHYLELLKRGEIRRMLFVPTGALMSPISVQQGESIPSVAHAVIIVSE